MTRLQIDPAAAAAEMAEFSVRMSSALQRLASLDAGGEGCTPRTAVWRRDKTVLWRYQPLAGASRLPPLVICYALVNRPYMLDLQPDRSLIRGLLAQGIDVYLVDWGYPDAADRALTLDDYINRYLGDCIGEASAAAGGAPVNLLGVCQGGTMSICHVALHPQRIRNLVTMVTPVDFHGADNLLAKWARKIDVDGLVESLGNVPGELLNAAFVALAPLRLGVQKYAGLAELADDPEGLANFLRMERWIRDSPDQAGRAFAQFVRWFFHDNRLLRGGLEIGGSSVDLRRIECPLLNIYAAQDHLVPPAASRALAGLTGSRDYRELEFQGGHIGIYVSRRAQEQLPREIAGWLAAH